MQKRTLLVRIVAILLCALIILGAFTVAITAFAAETVEPIVNTGSDPKLIWIAVAAVVAVIVAVVCVVTSRKDK